MKHPYTAHHIVPKSRDGSNHRDNIVMLRDNIHVALHMIFCNRLPNEQIQRILEIGDSALTREFKADINKILQETDNAYYYKNGLLIPRK